MSSYSCEARELSLTSLRDSTFVRAEVNKQRRQELAAAKKEAVYQSVFRRQIRMVEREAINRVEAVRVSYTVWSGLVQHMTRLIYLNAHVVARRSVQLLHKEHSALHRLMQKYLIPRVIQKRKGTALIKWRRLRGAVKFMMIWLPTQRRIREFRIIGPVLRCFAKLRRFNLLFQRAVYRYRSAAMTLQAYFQRKVMQKNIFIGLLGLQFRYREIRLAAEAAQQQKSRVGSASAKKGQPAAKKSLFSPATDKVPQHIRVELIAEFLSKQRGLRYQAYVQRNQEDQERMKRAEASARLQKDGTKMYKFRQLSAVHRGDAVLSHTLKHCMQTLPLQLLIHKHLVASLPLLSMPLAHPRPIILFPIPYHLHISAPHPLQRPVQLVYTKEQLNELVMQGRKLSESILRAQRQVSLSRLRPLLLPVQYQTRWE